MFRAAVLLALFAIAPGVRADARGPDDLCGAVPAYALTADETAVLRAVAAHYKQGEWRPKDDHGAAAFAEGAEFRHIVISMASPVVIYRRTIPYTPYLDAALHVELQRHQIPADVAAGLSNTLRSRNGKVSTLDASDIPGTVSINCRDLMGMAFFGTRPSGDMTNAEKAVSISLPAFDAAGTTALVLTVNGIRYLLKGDTAAMELVLLRRRSAGPWKIEWHTGVGQYMRWLGSPAAAATAEDYRVFDALLAHLDGTRFRNLQCVAIVNQTDIREWLSQPPNPPDVKASWSKSAAADFDRRAMSSAYIGEYQPRRVARLVPREEYSNIFQAAVGGCPGAISVSLPGYGSSNEAVIEYSSRNVTPQGTEIGGGSALLRRTQSGWSVDRDSYERHALIPPPSSRTPPRGTAGTTP